MNRIPLQQRGKEIGELLIQQGTTETMFRARCHLTENELWNIWVVGETGEFRLGLLTRVGSEFVFEKRFSRRMTDHLGRLLYGELRTTDYCKQNECRLQWKPLGQTSCIHTAWMRRQLYSWPGILSACAGEGRWIAVPYAVEQPFPLMPVFCFAQMQIIAGHAYLVVRFDGREQPRFQ